MALKRLSSLTHYCFVTATLILCLSATSNAGERIVPIRMLDTPPSFSPSNVTIEVGDTVKWENVGNSVHHATDDHEMAIKSDDVSSPTGSIAFDSGFLRPGESFTHKFDHPGTYRYVCVAHEASGMMGEIVVKPASSLAKNGS